MDTQENFKNKTILALDQATKVTGWALFKEGELIDSGIYTIYSDCPVTQRINILKHWLIKMIDKHKPDLIGLEDIQLQEENSYSKKSMGVTVYKTLAKLQGVLIDTLFELKIEKEIIFPSTWRKYCKIKGNNKKEMKQLAQNLVKEKYNKNVTNDEADAIGLGLYLCNKPVEIEEKIIIW